MKTIPSTEFQKAYPRLTEPHEVTALGRKIGTWVPATATVELHEVSLVKDPPLPSYQARPVTPAPKPTRKK